LSIASLHGPTAAITGAPAGGRRPIPARRRVPARPGPARPGVPYGQTSLTLPVIHRLGHLRQRRQRRQGGR